MNKQEFFAFHAETCAKLLEISKAKNQDYSGTGDDPFANFTRVEALGIATTEQGMLTRMSDKLSRLASFCQSGSLQVKDESVEDTLRDMANYAILMLGYLKAKNEDQERRNAVAAKLRASEPQEPAPAMLGLKAQLDALGYKE